MVHAAGLYIFCMQELEVVAHWSDLLKSVERVVVTDVFNSLTFDISSTSNLLPWPCLDLGLCLPVKPGASWSVQALSGVED